MFKLLALLFMTLDHVGVYFRPLLEENTYLILRMIGRFAFPMFAYSVVKSIYFTKNIDRYLRRLLFFALVTEFVLSITAFYTGHHVMPNVLYTFILGVVFCMFIDILYGKEERCSPVLAHWLKKRPQWSKAFCLTGIILIHLFCYVVRPDYDIYGLYTIYIYKQIFDSYPDVFGPRATKVKSLRSFIPVCSSFLIFNLIYLIFEASQLFPFTETSLFLLMQHFSIFHITFLPIDWRATKKPSKLYQYSFYFYYPAHLVLFMLLTKSIV